MSFKDRLLSIETEFFSALVQGDVAISLFNERWEALLDDLAIDTLDSDILTLAHTTASRIAALADTSIELYINYDDFTNQLVDQLGSMMSELVISQDPSFTSHGSANEELPPPSRVLSQSRKRRRSTSPSHCKRQRVGAPAVVLSDAAPRSSQGARIDCLSSTTLTPSRSPLCSPSQPLPSDASEILPPSPVCIPRSRKRRLSAADASPPARHTKIHIGPRLHAASDSYVGYQYSQGTATPTDITHPFASSLADAPIVTEVPQEPLDLFPMASNVFDPPSAWDFGNIPSYPATHLAVEGGMSTTLGGLWKPCLDAPTSSSISPLPNLLDCPWTRLRPAIPLPKLVLDSPLSEVSAAQGDDDLLPHPTMQCPPTSPLERVPPTVHESSGGWLSLLLPDYPIPEDSTVDWDLLLDQPSNDFWKPSCLAPCPPLSYSESSDSEDDSNCSPSTQSGEFIQVPIPPHPDTQHSIKVHTKVAGDYDESEISDHGINNTPHSSLIL